MKKTGRIGYIWEGVTLEFDPATGTSTTRFLNRPDRIGIPNLNDTVQGGRLGISPAYYRLALELARHLVEQNRLAGNGEMDRLAPALVHHSVGGMDDAAGDAAHADALLELATKIDIDHLGSILEWLIAAPLGSTLDLREAEW